MQDTIPTQSDVDELIEVLTPLTWQWRISYFRSYEGRVTCATSFSYEDQVITHEIATQNLDIDVFTLDTGRLFTETYDVFAQTLNRYPNLKLKAYYPQASAVENWVQENGINGFYDSIQKRRDCCAIRKIEPLGRALKGAKIWISGLRREHSNNRGNLPLAEFDPVHNLIKVYPLIDVNEDTIRPYLSEHNIPYNKLHDKGYPSIGCAPCTRAIKPGEHSRSGRWWWEQDDAQECGLHIVNGRLVRAKNLDKVLAE